jgi:hypothetical protein
MTKELVIGNAHAYNFVHVAAAINHPDVGKVLDISGDVNTEAGIEDASVFLYPYNGYGDADLIRVLMTRHKIPNGQFILGQVLNGYCLEYKVTRLHCIGPIQVGTKLATITPEHRTLLLPITLS